MDKFAEYFLFASIPVFLLCLLSTRKMAILSSLPALLICAYFYVPFFTQYQVQSTEKDEYLRVGTFNIWNHNADIDAVVSVINRSGADVIALQEITEVQQSSLVDLLSKTYPYYYVSKQVYGGTTALFSRSQLSKLKELDSGIDRPAIIADIKWQGKVVTVASAHLNPSFWAYYQKPWSEIPGNFHQYIKDQNTQAQMIIDSVRLRTGSDASILACDCNSQETASTNRLLRTVFNDAFRSLGWQLGSPHDAFLKYERNLSHIDYIWYTGDVRAAAIYRAKESAGSDHEPVIADFVF